MTLVASINVIVSARERVGARAMEHESHLAGIITVFCATSQLRCFKQRTTERHAESRRACQHFRRRCLEPGRFF